MLLMRISIFVPFHTALGFIIGANIVKTEIFGEHKSWYQIILFPWLIHGAFDFVQFSLLFYF
eukprot:UN00722